MDDERDKLSGPFGKHIVRLNSSCPECLDDLDSVEFNSFDISRILTVLLVFKVEFSERVAGNQPDS